MTERTRFLLLGLIFAVCAVFVGVRTYDVVVGGIIDRFSTKESEAVLFTGDIMLARDVEDRIRLVGEDRFFDLVRPLHERARYVIGNFEAAVPAVYVPTPDLTFQFSVDHALLPFLRSAHVTHVSLANNHADDYGVSARVEGMQSLTQAGFIPFGQPRSVASTSVVEFTVNEKRVAVIGVEDVLAPLDSSAVEAMIVELSKTTDVQIVYIHWGIEYELVHSPRQEELAHGFVAAGADAIIGHHPHVVQDIQLIDEVPVIYSLGNYVFDQYWDEEVQRGLTVLMTVEDSSLALELIPVRTDRARPRVQDEGEARAFLREIALRSTDAVRSSVLRGLIVGRLQ